MHNLADERDLSCTSKGRGLRGGAGHINVKLPVVRELELQAGVVARFNDDEVCHEVGAKRERGRLDLTCRT